MKQVKCRLEKDERYELVCHPIPPVYDKNSRVLDPCCGSGAFLVRAMTDAMDDCETEEDREEVKKN